MEISSRIDRPKIIELVNVPEGDGCLILEEMNRNVGIWERITSLI